MKDTDKKQFELLLIKLIGKRCSRTFACNSIKLRFETDNNIQYIWIDPPWEFFCKNYKITDSYECPHHTEEDYPLKFKIWCDRFSPLDSILFINYRFNIKNDLILEFDKAYKIIVPFTIPNPEEELWYSHWYCKV